MAKIAGSWDHRAWEFKDCIPESPARPDEREADHRKPFGTIVQILSRDASARFRVFDLGAGYGTGCQFLPAKFLEAVAVSQKGLGIDGQTGREQMARLDRRGTDPGFENMRSF